MADICPWCGEPIEPGFPHYFPCGDIPVKSQMDYAAEIIRLRKMLGECFHGYLKIFEDGGIRDWSLEAWHMVEKLKEFKPNV